MPVFCNAGLKWTADGAQAESELAGGVHWQRRCALSMPHDSGSKASHNQCLDKGR
jgi:hypothetical protein